jgi:hypothetical protein
MRGANKAIALSDHSDYPSLLEFVKRCEPKEVVVAHAKNAEPIIGSIGKATGIRATAAWKGFSITLK